MTNDVSKGVPRDGKRDALCMLTETAVRKNQQVTQFSFAGGAGDTGTACQVDRRAT